MTNMVHCQLWMGSLESYMTETFVIQAFVKMGENPLNVKIMRNKATGEAAGYCFVHFATDEEAINAMHRLNGKPIPSTSPMVRFKLNNASNTGRTLIDREFSVWVGDLSPDVDDYNLYRVFSSKYNTIKTAKVILDSSGYSKGYGFVRFGSEDEMKNSITTMNGYTGLGSKTLKICNAVPKPRGAVTGNNNSSASSSTYGSGANEYQNYYDPSSYWQNYPNWQGQGYYENADQSKDQSSEPLQSKEDADSELIEHTVTLDVDKMNKEKMEQDSNLWDALESSKWLPCDALEVC